MTTKRQKDQKVCKTASKKHTATTKRHRATKKTHKIITKRQTKTRKDAK